MKLSITGILPLLILMSALNSHVAFAESKNEPKARSSEQLKTQHAIVVEQKHPFFGNREVIITPDALRINMSEGRAYFVAKAPDWHVVFFNVRDNTGVTRTFKEFMDHDQGWYHYGATFIPPTAVTKEEKLGTKRYLGRDFPSYGTLLIQQNGMIDPQKRFCRISYVMNDSRIVTPAFKIANMLCNFKYLPALVVYSDTLYYDDAEQMKMKLKGDVSGIMDMAKRSGGKLESTQISERNYASEYFNYPTGFKVVKSEPYVFADSVKRKQSDQMLNELLK